jgi:putative membrane protein
MSATPYQHTMVTASSTGTVQVKVPMSASGMRLLDGNKPAVTNSVAQFTMTPNGTATDNVRSDFAGTVPLTVKPSYTLNGQPIQPSALAPTKKDLKKHYKSGTLQVTYVISNVTSEKTTVSFEGFNGAHITKTITDPIPIVAEVKLTFPKDASAIDAPGASIAAGKDGVKATWTKVLAPPLSAASQTISYSVKLSQAKAPEVTVEAEGVGSQATLSGKVPQSAATAVGSVQGQPEQGLGGSPISLGQANSDISGSQRSTSSRLESQKQGIIKANKTPANASLSKIQPSLDQMTNIQATDEQNMVASGNTQLNGLRDAGNAHLNGLQASGNTQLDGLRNAGNAQLSSLQDTANQAVAALAGEVASGSAQANAGVGAVLRSLMAELASSITSLRPLVSEHVAHLSAAVAVADAVSMTAGALRAIADDHLTVAKQHATDATVLDQLIITLIADANAFSPAEQSTPEWRKLASDLEAARTKADLVRSTAGDIAQHAADISTAAGKIQDAGANLKADVHNLSAEATGIQSKLTNDVLAAQRNLESSIAHVSGMVKNFQAQIAAAQSTIGQATDNVRASIGQATSNAQATVGQATSNAKATVGQVTSNAQAAVNAAGQKASSDLAAGKQKVQATVQQAVGSVQAALDKANSDYAQLLAITQIAQANQLPGGNATGANVQNGAYVLRIADTG